VSETTTVYLMLQCGCKASLLSI